MRAGKANGTDAPFLEATIRDGMSVAEAKLKRREIPAVEGSETKGAGS